MSMIAVGQGGSRIHLDYGDRCLSPRVRVRVQGGWAGEKQILVGGSS